MQAEDTDTGITDSRKTKGDEITEKDRSQKWPNKGDGGGHVRVTKNYQSIPAEVDQGNLGK